MSGPGRIANVAVQEICPANTSEHLNVGTTDPVAAALALDALDHDGPAKLSRIAATVCAQPYMPGVDPVTGPADLAAAAAQLADSTANFPHSDEPRPRCWTKLRVRACHQRRRAAA